MKYLMVSLLFLTGCSIRTSKIIASIQRIEIYDHFYTMGYTTSGAYGKFLEFDNQKTRMLEVPRSRRFAIGVSINSLAHRLQIGASE